MGKSQPWKYVEEEGLRHDENKCTNLAKYIHEIRKRLVQRPNNFSQHLYDSLGFFLVITKWLLLFQALYLYSWQKEWDGPVF